MFYVEYLKPFPDYKSPTVDYFVKFYNTEEDADKGILKFKKELLQKWSECFLDYNDLPDGIKLPLKIEDLDSDAYFDHIYSDYYMDLPPYSAEKGKVEISE